MGASINVWPFAGILIALLIMFMVYQPPMHYRPWGWVDLPISIYAASQPRAVKEDAIRIVVSRDGSVFFCGLRTEPEVLPELIRESIQRGSERRVYLAVDARARYADAAAVIDKIREAGIRDVAIMADKTAVH